MAEPNLEKLERQYEQAKARLQSARARKAAKDRKLDARRKIILGGALIEKASRDPEVTKLLMSLVAGLSRVQDRKAFDGWSPPAPEADEMANDGPGDVGRTSARAKVNLSQPNPKAEAGTTGGGGEKTTDTDGAGDGEKDARMERRP